MRTIYRILAIIILLCDIEFVKMENPRHEAVFIKDEKVLRKGNKYFNFITNLNKVI